MHHLCAVFDHIVWQMKAWNPWFWYTISVFLTLFLYSCGQVFMFPGMCLAFQDTCSLLNKSGWHFWVAHCLLNLLNVNLRMLLQTVTFSGLSIWITVIVNYVIVSLALLSPDDVDKEHRLVMNQWISSILYCDRLVIDIFLSKLFNILRESFLSFTIRW